MVGLNYMPVSAVWFEAIKDKFPVMDPANSAASSPLPIFFPPVGHFCSLPYLMLGTVLPHWGISALAV